MIVSRKALLNRALLFRCFDRSFQFEALNNIGTRFALNVRRLPLNVGRSSKWLYTVYVIFATYCDFDESWFKYHTRNALSVFRFYLITLIKECDVTAPPTERAENPQLSA